MTEDRSLLGPAGLFFHTPAEPDDGGEVFLPAVGFPKYEVSNYGRVRSHHRGSTRYLKPVNCKGYCFVNLQCGSSQKLIKINVLVLEAFVGPKPADKDLCAHWDDNKANNRLDNLRWATHAENSADAYRNGRRPLGINCPHVVLTEATVLAAYERLVSGSKIIDVAKEFGINSGVVCKIKYGHSWSTVTGAKRVPIPGRLIPRDVLQSALSAWLAGLSLREAAKAHGISKTGLTGFIERCGGHPGDRNSLGGYLA